tara:strand:- start:1839 stop:2093 length:255 start_codon:yes stop_codon:yes gene_type:complete
LIDELIEKKFNLWNEIQLTKSIVFIFLHSEVKEIFSCVEILVPFHDMIVKELKTAVASTSNAEVYMDAAYPVNLCFSLHLYYDE